MIKPGIEIDSDAISNYCRKWRIIEFSLFGSVLREDFRPESDIDVLIRLDDAAPWSYFEWVEMKEELEALLGRRVDLVEVSGLRNPFRKQTIMSERQVFYAA